MKGERRTDAFKLARAQLAGGVPADFGDRLCICQRCGDDINILVGLDACAFCNGCKDAVLDALAAKLLSLEPKLKKTSASVWLKRKTAKSRKAA
jgi:hypothetical protein